MESFAMLAEFLKLPKFIMLEIEAMPKQQQEFIITTLRNAIVDELEVMITHLKYADSTIH